MTFRNRIRCWVQDLQCQLEEFMMFFDERFRGKCGVCGLGTPSHKMDCYREYVKVNRRG